MALSNQDRVLEKSTTTGTGTYTLAGTPGITGFNTNDYDTFASVGNANTVVYTAVGIDPLTGIPNNTGWEIGLGTYTASGTTLARTTIYRSTNANAAVNWGAGTRFIFCSPLTEGTLVVRQPGGTVGADEVQALHDGTTGWVKSLDGHLTLDSATGFVEVNYFGTINITISGGNGIIVRDTAGNGGLVGYNSDSSIGWRSKSDYFTFGAGMHLTWVSGNVWYSGSEDLGLKRGAAGVFYVTNGSSGTGWLQQSAGRAILTSNATNATATMANLTGLTISNLKAGRKYSFKMIVYAANSTAAEGAKFDFDGGSATMTSFRAHGTLFDTALLLSTQTTAIATDFAQGIMTGDSMFEVHGSFTVNGAGTLIPRFAENSSATGTLTAYLGSHIWVEDCP